MPSQFLFSCHERSLQTCVKFNPSNPTELISNGKRRAFFWQSCLPEAAAFKYYSPPLSSPDFKQKIGLFTTSAFIPGTTQAITATQDGDVVVWDEQGISVEVGTRPTDRKAVKLMRLHNSRLSFISSIGDFIVTGADDGHVRFFDPMLRLIAWFEHISAGAVRTVSFSRARPRMPADPADFDAFVCPDFLVGTVSGAVVRLTADAFNTLDDDRRSGSIVMRGLVGEIACCIAHPVRQQLLLVGSSGRLQLLDTARHELAAERTLDCGGGRATCAAYSRTGSALALGTASGAVAVLDAATLAEVVLFRQSKAAVVAVSVSSAAAHIAAVTADGHTMLFFLVPYKQSKRWEYVGRTRVHYAPAVAVHFGEAPSGETRCFSLSRDGRLVEYNLGESCLERGVLISGQLPVCPHTVPTAMSFTPPLTYFQRGVIDTQLIIADASHHVRVFNPDTSVTSGTFRGPTCSDPIAQMAIFQSASSSSTFLAFRCCSGLPAWMRPCPCTAAFCPSASRPRSALWICARDEDMGVREFRGCGSADTSGKKCFGGAKELLLSLAAGLGQGHRMSCALQVKKSGCGHHAVADRWAPRNDRGRHGAPRRARGRRGQLRRPAPDHCQPRRPRSAVAN